MLSTHKDGNKRKCENCTGITVFGVLEKILARIFDQA